MKRVRECQDNKRKNVIAKDIWTIVTSFGTQILLNVLPTRDAQNALPLQILLHRLQWNQFANEFDVIYWKMVKF